jgi:hypothetical protein
MLLSKQSFLKKEIKEKYMVIRVLQMCNGKGWPITGKVVCSGSREGPSRLHLGERQYLLVAEYSGWLHEEPGCQCVR